MPITLAQHRDALIERLYDAALFGEPWDGWLGQVVECAGARSGLLILQNTETLEIAYTAEAGYGADQRTLYEREFRGHDVWTQTMQRLPRERFFPTEAVLPYRAFKRTLIYNAYCRGLDIAHASAAFLSMEGPWAVRFCVQRSHSQGAFEAAELELLQSLVPHLRRCVSLAESVGLLRTGLDTLLDRYEAPCLLVTTTRMVVAQNRAAQELLAELPCLSVQRGRLAIKGGDLATRMDELIRNCHLPPTEAAAAAAAVVKLPRKDRPPLIVSAIPVPGGSPFRPFGQPVILLFKDAARRPPADARALAEIYGLTRTEARVAELIGSGLPVKRVATQLAVSVNAIKFHLRAIYAKTGVHRQSDLVSLVLSLSAR